MTEKPDYVIHTVSEKEISVDWFFGRGFWAVKVRQGLLIIVAWFFALLPVAMTASALIYRDDPERGWWSLPEGFALWDRTITFLTGFFVLFVVFFFALFVADRIASRKRNATTTYDEDQLAKRLEIAERMYTDKYGPRELRLQQQSVRIQPYAAIETFELRGLYRENGVE